MSEIVIRKILKLQCRKYSFKFSVRTGKGHHGEIFFFSNTNYLTCQATNFEDKLNCINAHFFLFFKRFTYSDLLLLQQQLRTSKSIPTTKVVVTFCLRLRNKFQSFPTKNQSSDWLTQ